MNSRPYRNRQRRPCAARRSTSRRARRSRHDTDIGLLTDARSDPRATAFHDDDRHCKNCALALLYRATRLGFHRPPLGRNNPQLWRSHSDAQRTPISSSVFAPAAKVSAVLRKTGIAVVCILASFSRIRASSAASEASRALGPIGGSVALAAIFSL